MRSTLHSFQCLRRAPTLGGQLIELLDERSTNFLAHHAVEILRVRAQFLQVHFRHLLVRLGAFHREDRTSSSSRQRYPYAHSWPWPSCDRAGTLRALAVRAVALAAALGPARRTSSQAARASNRTRCHAGSEAYLR